MTDSTLHTNLTADFGFEKSISGRFRPAEFEVKDSSPPPKLPSPGLVRSEIGSVGEIPEDARETVMAWEHNSVVGKDFLGDSSSDEDSIEDIQRIVS